MLLLLIATLIIVIVIDDFHFGRLESKREQARKRHRERMARLERENPEALLAGVVDRPVRDSEDLLDELEANG